MLNAGSLFKDISRGECIHNKEKFSQRSCVSFPASNGSFNKKITAILLDSDAFCDMRAT